MVNKKMKYASMAGVGLMVIGLLACTNPDEQQKATVLKQLRVHHVRGNEQKEGELNT